MKARLFEDIAGRVHIATEGRDGLWHNLCGSTVWPHPRGTMTRVSAKRKPTCDKCREEAKR